jgi:hypothetical protein
MSTHTGTNTDSNTNSNSDTSDPFSNPELLRIPEEQMVKIREGQRRAEEAKSRKLPPFPRAKGFRFYLLPTRVLEDIALYCGDTALLVLLVLIRLWFNNHCHNPVKLTSKALAKFDLTRNQKLRALKVLEETGHISVERSRGKNPQITLNWQPH